MQLLILPGREQTKFVHLLADADDGEVEEELDELNFDALEHTVT